jgi:hypothetical protein
MSRLPPSLRSGSPIDGRGIGAQLDQIRADRARAAAAKAALLDATREEADRIADYTSRLGLIVPPSAPGGLTDQLRTRRASPKLSPTIADAEHKARHLFRVAPKLGQVADAERKARRLFRVDPRSHLAPASPSPNPLRERRYTTESRYWSGILSTATGIRTPALGSGVGSVLRALMGDLAPRAGLLRIRAGGCRPVSARLGPPDPSDVAARLQRAERSEHRDGCLLVVVGDPWRLRPDVAESVADAIVRPPERDGGNSAPVAGAGQAPRSLDGAHS